MKLISANANVVGTSPFIHSQVLVKTEPDTGNPIPSAPYLAGVDPATVGTVNVLPGSIMSGAFDLSDKGLVVGRGYAALQRPERGRPRRHLVVEKPAKNGPHHRQDQYRGYRGRRFYGARHF